MLTLLERIRDAIAPAGEDPPDPRVGAGQRVQFLDPLRETDLEQRARSRQAQWRLQC
jgi:hypothetical protein